MISNEFHRLLKRQLKKLDASDETISAISPFLQSVDEAYKSFDKDVVHLENILEISSQELFKANERLKADIKVKSEEVDNTNKKIDIIVNSVNDIIFQTDTLGKYTFLNSSWEKITGVKTEDAIGKHMKDFFHFVPKEDLEKLDKLNLRLRATDLAISELFRFQSPNGERIWLEVTMQKTYSKNNEYNGVIGTFRDITALVKANKAKDEFLSTMSHEIRTPLNAVVGISNVLLMNDPLPDQIENLNALKFSSNHLMGLINDILDFNKIEEGKIDFESSEFSLKHLIEGIDNTLGFVAREKGLKFVTKTDSNVPQVLKGDGTRLNQVLTNLINNAIKFTEEGKIILDIETIHIDEKEVKLHFEVIDTGIGIEKEKLEKIFESFTQANSKINRKYGGTGLGLAISSKLLLLQKSVLKVKSDYGSGTSFYFDLSFEASDRFDVQAPKYVQVQPSFSGLEGLEVLVAEDNKMNVLVIKQFFKKWKISMDLAVNGQIALEMVKQKEYDLVLMDLQMPIMDGYSSTIAIRNLEDEKISSIPIVALTASAHIEVLTKTKELGMNNYLSKPFDPVDLYQLLKSYYDEKMKKK